jgi:hypothetical protein
MTSEIGRVAGRANKNAASLPKHAKRSVSCGRSTAIREPCATICINPPAEMTKLCQCVPCASTPWSNERSAMNVNNIEGLMRAMELEGTARIDIIRIGKDIQTAGYARRSPSVQQYDELRRAVVHWQRIADDIGRIIGSG